MARFWFALRPFQTRLSTVSDVWPLQSRPHDYELKIEQNHNVFLIQDLTGFTACKIYPRYALFAPILSLPENSGNIGID
jgi:hypothetical protein